MKILVTGANGYIGSKVVKYLLDRGDIDVISVDLSNEHIDNRSKFIKCDILNLDFNQVNLFDFFSKPDICLHMAWRDGFIHNSASHIKDLSQHYKFLENLVANGLRNLVLMGTMHEIGFWNGVINEDTPCKPTNLYGISKNALRDSSKILCSKYNCNWKWLRAFYIYGNDFFGASVFCKIRKSFADGAKEFNLTKGSNKFDFISVEDLVKLIVCVSLQENVNGIINVCSGVPISLKSKILEYVAENDINLKLNWGFYPERESESPCIYGDTTKLKQALKEYEKIEKRR